VLVEIRSAASKLNYELSIEKKTRKEEKGIEGSRAGSGSPNLKDLMEHDG
jgi:hypothetical protein